MSKTWIDLTDIVNWSGQHGGTQRVVYGIANEYYLDPTQNTGFCVFDPSTENFYEFDFKIIRDRVKRVAESPTINGVSEKSALLKIKENLVDYLPSYIVENDKVRKTGKRGLKLAYKILKKGKKSLGPLKKHAKSIKPIGKRVSFSSSDKLLLLGKPWDTPEMTPTVARMKKRIGFKVGAIVYDQVITLYPHLHAKSLFKLYSQFMFELMQAADILYPISESTKHDTEEFCKRLNLTCPPQRVIRLGDALESVVNSAKPEGPIVRKFILCVGTIEVRKNHTLLYYVYKLAAERGIDLPQLIIVGRPGWNSQDIYNLMKADAVLQKKILIMESVSDLGLAWLYENCLFTVYPSIYEGWGLPVAESIQHGKLAIASHASSITEIAGNLLDYFSPYSPSECLDLIVKYSDSVTREAADKKLMQNYKATTWRETYTQVRKGITSK